MLKEGRIQFPDNFAFDITLYILYHYFKYMQVDRLYLLL